MDVEISRVTWQGPPERDDALLSALPAELRSLLAAINGYVQMGGALHVRGACGDPDWHSLDRVWRGDGALHRLYDAVLPGDVPFAQDCVGDQFLLRDGAVLRLSAETGEVEEVGCGLFDFLRRVEEDPIDALGMEPLLRLMDDGGELRPGELVSVYPPFAFAADDRSYRPVPALELNAFHAGLARQLRDLPDGTPVQIRFTP